ncbi:MAG: ABC transporter ATP-binding protein [bacterium]|nr:ABC transporter ATP-binding protein [bacterium]
MLISATNLHKTYRFDQTEVLALRGVDIQIKSGEFIAIMGPSGSGKSTLMHILGCLDKPSQGEYQLDGIKVSELDDKALSRIRNTQIGFVFQFHNLLPQLTVLENVEMPLIYAGVSRRIRTKKAKELLDAVGLGHRLNHVSTKLSGGESQRAAIARALANDPKLILADEPTGNLDTKTGEQIMALFQKINEMGRTIVLVTHEHDIAQHAKRIIFVKDGKIQFDHPIQEKDRIIAKEIKSL